MAGEAGSAETGHKRRWDVALSFAGAQRDYVGQVAEALKALGLRCFYDADEQVRLWGTYLAEELPSIYARESAAVVVFISADYAGGDWTRLERRAAFSRAVAEAGVYVLPARFDGSELPGLLSDVVTVDLRRYAPEQFAGLIAEKLADLAISPPPSPNRPDAGRPPGAVRVAEADLRQLGVHAAISMPGIADEIPPEYVPRDTDAAEHGVRTKVAAAAQRGGFVLLTGGSSVGKTRCAAEAVKALLPDWWLVHPAGPGEVAALAAAPPARTVVWLDELQRYLDGEHGLVGGTVRALLKASGPVVIVAMLWPDRYAAYTVMPPPGAPDPHAREREVLELATVIRIRAQFSAAEQDRARDAATRDPRLAAAVKAEEYGLTQTLAAAPQLAAQWEDAQETNPYAWAILTVALDAARLGARAPLAADLLRAAAPGYCTPAQQAEAPANWFEQALVYATAKLHGAAAALAPAGTSMGQTSGYAPADYLLQHAARERRTAHVPTSTWDALLSHIRDTDDAARLARSAENRPLYRYAISLYRYAVEVGDLDAVLRLADLLAGRGDLIGAVQVLRARADAGDLDAVMRLSDLLVDHGDLEELRARADAGDWYATTCLADMLAERGDLDELRARANAGDWYAVLHLADLLAGRGDLVGAVQVLRARAEAGDMNAAIRLADLLAERGDLDELRAQADTGDWYAAMRLAGLLAERGDLEELRARVDAGDWYATTCLADMLAERGDLDELRARANAGDEDAAMHLADLLADREDLVGAVQVLRDWAGAGDEDAAMRLAGLLAELGDPDGALQVLRDQAAIGSGDAARSLADLLAERGDLDGALQVLRARTGAGDEEAARSLADLLAERGDLDELRDWADAGDEHAARRLADLLAERGDLDELRARADAGDLVAGMRLADLLVDRGDLDELRARADAGDLVAGMRLADLLAERGDLDELRARADAGDGRAANRLVGLLAKRGDLDAADRVLRGRADVGDGNAEWLAELLTQRGCADEAKRLLQFGLNPDRTVASR